MADIMTMLRRSAVSGRARHAYLIACTDAGKAESIARSLAALLLFGDTDTARLVDEPDFFELDGSLSIARFRDELRPEIYRETYGKSCRVIYFKNAHQLSQPVQNAMLKVLEEPPAATHFILTGSEHGILPTIRSRCTVVRCPSSSVDETASELKRLGAADADALLYARMSGADSLRAKRLLSDERYRGMRTALFKAFISALCGAPDFGFCREKREREDWLECTQLLLLFAHDMLRAALNDEAEFCPDFASEIKKLSLRFTIGDIGCIIDNVTEAAVRTATNAGGGAVFDRLFARTAELAGGEGRKRH